MFTQSAACGIRIMKHFLWGELMFQVRDLLCPLNIVEHR